MKYNKDIKKLTEYKNKGEKHYVEMYLSSLVMIKKKVLNVLLENKILCNIENLNSVVYNKKKGLYQIEKGFKITIFEINDIDLIKLYYNLIKNISINCFWVNIDKDFFNGCITQYEPYLKIINELKLTKKVCSEYL